MQACLSATDRPTVPDAPPALPQGQLIRRGDPLLALRTAASSSSRDAPAAALLDVDALIAAYHERRPDSEDPAQRVAFGTSGHRGSPLSGSFNAAHVQAITQAICQYRLARGISGPLFLGVDTHALSQPACRTALEVLAGNGVDVMLALDDAPTPTPAVSFAILAHNLGRISGLADGIVLTPSHNPPGDGGLKYHPPHGGAAGQDITAWIDQVANRLLPRLPIGLRRLPELQALQAASTHGHDFRTPYVEQLDSVINLDLIRHAGLRLAVDPLGGAGVQYWIAIAERWGLDLSLLDEALDPTFREIPPGADGQIRTDPSSPAAVARLVALVHADSPYDVGIACDADHDRHGIVTRGAGLMPANDYLATAVDHLLRHRPAWRTRMAIGRSVVTTRLIDRIATAHGRTVFDVPVGFKWFAAGLRTGHLAIACEESAGLAFVRRDGSVWTTDKDGITAGLLAAEITARTGEDPAQRYRWLTRTLGTPRAQRLDRPASADQRQALRRIAPEHLEPSLTHHLGGEPVSLCMSRAPGNGAPLDGLVLEARSGWVALRPSGTEPMCKLYAESFIDADHLAQLMSQAQALLVDALASMSPTQAPTQAVSAQAHAHEHASASAAPPTHSTAPAELAPSAYRAPPP